MEADEGGDDLQDQFVDCLIICHISIHIRGTPAVPAFWSCHQAASGRRVVDWDAEIKSRESTCDGCKVYCMLLCQERNYRESEMCGGGRFRTERVTS